MNMNGKTPEHAKCVFKGQIFDVYQWEQKMFDGSTAIFERIRRPDSALVIAMQGEMVFYAKQEQPHTSEYSSLIGGRVDEGEDTLEAVKRELLEEAGMASDDWSLLSETSFPGKIDWDMYIYVARDCKKIAEPKLDAGEKIEICSCHIDKFLTEVITGDDFYERDLRNEILSALNPAAVEGLKKKILG